MTHPYTTSLEHSKKLADACQKMGVEMPKTEYNWVKYDNNSDWVLTYKDYDHRTVPMEFQIRKAPNLGELMRMLPKKIYTKNKNPYFLQFSYSDVDEKWRFSYCNKYENACAEMLFEKEIENAACELLTSLILLGKVTELRI